MFFYKIMNENDRHQLQLIVYNEMPALPESERPDQRILRDGPAACSTLELLQIIIGGHDAERVARELLSHCQDERGIAIRPIGELTAYVNGLGHKKALQLKASIEFGRRMLTGTLRKQPLIKTPADAAHLLIPEMSLLEQEEVRVMMLNSRNHVLGVTTVYRGSINSASMRVAELFREAIRQNALNVIIAHNHPSGDCSASQDDLITTKEMIKAGKLLECQVLDHLIIGHGSFLSIKEHHAVFDERV